MFRIFAFAAALALSMTVGEVSILAASVNTAAAQPASTLVSDVT